MSRRIDGRANREFQSQKDRRIEPRPEKKFGARLFCGLFVCLCQNGNGEGAVDDEGNRVYNSCDKRAGDDGGV